MDKLPINEKINLSTRMHASIYIGVIKEFFKDTWEITFKVPLIIDNLEKYPRAVPLFHHEYELFPNDEVIILVTTQADPTQCYYMPITLYKFMGLKHGVNFVDITKDGIIDLETNNFYSFAIENSEHRTLKTRTDVSDKHQIDANDIVINIPINPETQQDIISNRHEPVVESKPIGSRKTNITGNDTTTQVGDNTTNVSGNFTQLNTNGLFIFGNKVYSTTDKVKEQSNKLYCNNIDKNNVGLTGRFLLPIFTEVSGSIIHHSGYYSLFLINGRIVGGGIFYHCYNSNTNKIDSENIQGISDGNLDWKLNTDSGQIIASNIMVGIDNRYDNITKIK